MTGAALTRTGGKVNRGCGIIAKRKLGLCALLHAPGISIPEKSGSREWREVGKEVNIIA